MRVIKQKDVPEEGELKRTKKLIAAAVKLWWLKRGSHDEGRDLAVPYEPQNN